MCKLYVLTHFKTLNVLGVNFYLHSVSCNFSNSRCRLNAYGNSAILLSLMQRITGYLLTLQLLEFWRSFGDKRPVTSKRHGINVTREKKLPDFIMFFFFAFENGC